MKAILIDVDKETVTEVDLIDKDIMNQMYKLIKCELVEVGINLGNGNVIMVDEDGMLKRNPRSKYFAIKGVLHRFIGNGIVIGSDDDGDFISHKLDFNILKYQIFFP